MGQNTQYDIVKEKEQLIDRLRYQKAECEKNLDAGANIPEISPIWGFLLLFTVLGISLFLSGNIIRATHWHPLIVFIACWTGVTCLLIYYPIEIIYRRPLKAKLKNLDSQIEEQQIKLAQIKRRIG